MGILYKIPPWFLGFDFLFQVLFAVTAFLVAFYSHKVHRISEEREIKLFSLAFLLIALSYVSWPLARLFTSFSLNSESLDVIYEFYNLEHILLVYPHVIFFILGLSVLVYSTFRRKDIRLFYLIAALAILPVTMAIQKTNMVYTVSSILIFFVLVHYINIYRERQNKKLLVTVVAFCFLLLATLDFILSDDQHIYYVGGHFLMLVSYILLLVRLTFNYRKWQKKDTG